jgi:hypothetical protein
MESFILINRMVADKGYGRFLSYLLVNKMLQVKIDEPDTLLEYSDIDFD